MRWKISTDADETVLIAVKRQATKPGPFKGLEQAAAKESNIRGWPKSPLMAEWSLWWNAI
jgi:hypothetical protein